MDLILIISFLIQINIFDIICFFTYLKNLNIKLKKLFIK